MTTSPPCLLLSINQHSRATFLETYTNLQLSPKYPSTIYIDLKEDTVFFDTLDCSPHGDLALDLATSSLRTRLRKLAISVELWEVLRVFRYEALSEIRCLSNLRTMALVLLREGREFGRVGDGQGMVTLADAAWETADGEIRNCLWYVENLRRELEKDVKQEKETSADANWEKAAPNVQLWLW